MNIKKGNPLQKGSTKQKDGYNFAIASAAEIIDLLLYAPKADERHLSGQVSVLL